ncbi:hypothetical protein [Sinorhizobium mexicanum]|nr:hypothetical protein [Sinorhizobium mexicanum]MBP1883359.1 hypothetical protein [Sinorhizobium mexicanum]
MDAALLVNAVPLNWSAPACDELNIAVTIGVNLLFEEIVSDFR